MPKTTPFDHLVTSHQQELIKVALPYLPEQEQRLLSIYVKVQELFTTFSLFSGQETVLSACELADDDDEPAAPNLISALKEYCCPKEAEFLDNFVQIQKILSLYRQSAKEGKDNDMGEVLKNLLTPEQQQMMNMFETMS